MKIRYATREDMKTLFDLIMELAVYEKLEDKVVTNPKILEEWIFDKQKAMVLLGEDNGNSIGYCLYFYNFSTFQGKAGIYIEDVYIKEDYRGYGYGTAFFKQIVEIAREEGCTRVDWSCLKWNDPSISLYKSLGAVPQEDWVGFRLETTDMKKLLKLEGK